ncbi:hypothetical protein Mapa_013460 [Marchantia paleacea]|nr:hypothetical protein Mapa_013460 [Marchantia paleacea]
MRATRTQCREHKMLNQLSTLDVTRYKASLTSLQVLHSSKHVDQRENHQTIRPVILLY